MYYSLSFSCMHQDSRDCIFVRCSFLLRIFIASMASDASSSYPAVVESPVVAVGPPAISSPAAAGDHPTGGGSPVAAQLTSPCHLADPKACTIGSCEHLKMKKTSFCAHHHRVATALKREMAKTGETMTTHETMTKSEFQKRLLDDKEEWNKLIEAYERDRPHKKTKKRE